MKLAARASHLLVSADSMKVVRPPTPGAAPSPVTSLCASPLCSPAVSAAFDYDVNNSQVTPFYPPREAERMAAPFYDTLEACVTDPFIQTKNIKNITGLIRPATKFCGRIHKLASNLLWQYLTFSVDGAYFVCFLPDKISPLSGSPPVSVPSGAQIDTVLPEDDAFYGQQPRWFFPIAEIRGIFTLESFDYFQSFSLIAPSCRRLVMLAEQTAVGAYDPHDSVRWFNVLSLVASEGKLDLRVIKQLAQQSILHTFMITIANNFYILRPQSQQELYHWLTILLAKWLMFRSEEQLSAVSSPILQDK